MFKNLILEALKLSQYRDFTKTKRKSDIDGILTEFFNTPGFNTNRSKDRIYLDIDISSMIKGENPLDTVSSNPLARKIEAILWDTTPQYIITNYLAGLCKKRDDTNPNNVFKIGKILNKLTTDSNPDTSSWAKILLRAYNNDDSRSINPSNSYKICISKHPYDIVGMSTNRGWTSCMDLTKGLSQTKMLYPDIEKGLLVCYLIKSTDLNIEHPFARVSLYPLAKRGSKDEYIYQCSTVCYGSVLKENIYIWDKVQKFIETWLDSTINSNKSGVFKSINGLYNEGISDIIFKNTDKPEPGPGKNVNIITIGYTDVEISLSGPNTSEKTNEFYSMNPKIWKNFYTYGKGNQYLSKTEYERLYDRMKKEFIESSSIKIEPETKEPYPESLLYYIPKQIEEGHYRDIITNKIDTALYFMIKGFLGIDETEGDLSDLFYSISRLNKFISETMNDGDNWDRVYHTFQEMGDTSLVRQSEDDIIQSVIDHYTMNYMEFESDFDDVVDKEMERINKEMDEYFWLDMKVKYISKTKEPIEVTIKLEF